MKIDFNEDELLVLHKMLLDDIELSVHDADEIYFEDQLQMKYNFYRSVVMNKITGALKKL